MYSIGDVIKSKFLEEMTQISVPSMAVTLLLACALACYIVLVYRITYRGVLFNSSFAISLILLAMITALAILTVTSNVVLSLGMVGALSIVRFRTAVKDPADTIFMFWAIVAGITTGAGLVLVAVFGTLLIGIVYLIVSLLVSKAKLGCWLMVIRYSEEAADTVGKAVKKLPSHRIKSLLTLEDGNSELVLELRSKIPVQKITDAIRAIDGVKEVSLAAYTGTTLL